MGQLAVFKMEITPMDITSHFTIRESLKADLNSYIFTGL